MGLPNIEIESRGVKHDIFSTNEFRLSLRLNLPLTYPKGIEYSRSLDRKIPLLIIDHVQHTVMS